MCGAGTIPEKYTAVRFLFSYVKYTRDANNRTHPPSALSPRKYDPQYNTVTYAGSRTYKIISSYRSTTADVFFSPPRRTASSLIGIPPNSIVVSGVFTRRPPNKPGSPYTRGRRRRTYECRYLFFFYINFYFFSSLLRTIMYFFSFPSSYKLKIRSRVPHAASPPPQKHTNNRR